MEHEILASVGGSFKNSADNGRKVNKGDKLGTIRQFGTQIPVTADCDGEVQWVRKDGIIRSRERLYLLAVPDVIAMLEVMVVTEVTVTTEVIPVPDIADAPAPEDVPPPKPAKKKRAPRRRA